MWYSTCLAFPKGPNQAQIQGGAERACAPRKFAQKIGRKEEKRERKEEKGARREKEREIEERERERKQRQREENLNTLALRERIKEEVEIWKGINHATIGIKVYPPICLIAWGALVDL